MAIDQQIEMIPIEQVKTNPNNPRVIKDDKYKKLLKSISEFPQMMEIRPIIVDENMMVLGGNMRLKACMDIGLKEVPILRASKLTEEQKKEFIIKDNQSYGQWDFLELSKWERSIIDNSGFDDWDIISIFGDNIMEDKFSKKSEESSFNPEKINVNDYIKTNILFFNELMIEFIDDEIKDAIKNITDKDGLLEDVKKIILKYGKNTL